MKTNIVEKFIVNNIEFDKREDAEAYAIGLEFGNDPTKMGEEINRLRKQNTGVIIPWMVPQYPIPVQPGIIPYWDPFQKQQWPWTSDRIYYDNSIISTMSTDLKILN